MPDAKKCTFESHRYFISVPSLITKMNTIMVRQLKMVMLQHVWHKKKNISDKASSEISAH